MYGKEPLTIALPHMTTGILPDRGYLEIPCGEGRSRGGVGSVSALIFLDPKERATFLVVARTHTGLVDCQPTMFAMTHEQ